LNIQGALDVRRFNASNVTMEAGFPPSTVEELFVLGHQIMLMPRYSLVRGKGMLWSVTTKHRRIIVLLIRAQTAGDASDGVLLDNDEFVERWQTWLG
jgi:hypothetical protein